MGMAHAHRHRAPWHGHGHSHSIVRECGTIGIAIGIGIARTP